MASFNEVGQDGAAFSDPFNIKDVMSSWGYQLGTIDSEAFLPVKETHETETAYIQVGNRANLADTCELYFHCDYVSIYAMTM